MDAPIIQPNFLQSEHDQITLLKAAKKAIEVMQAPAFDKFRKKLQTPPDRSSDDAIMLHLKKQLETVYHPVGTCKMGNDEMAVVDDQLRVKGIEGLRVIDASVMPTIVSGNTNATVYMIAEKAAEMILTLN
jgi:choline dehydrogenase